MRGYGLPISLRVRPWLLALAVVPVWFIFSALPASGQAPPNDLLGGRFAATGGQVWREYDLNRYSSTELHPERSVVRWILRATGEETWYGDQISVLSASSKRLRVFHTPEVQQKVAEIVERFMQPGGRHVPVHVQFVATTNLGWRDGLLHLLKPVVSGPEGQQVWLLNPEDASLLRSRMATDRGSRVMMDRRILLDNGQATAIESVKPLNYIVGLELTPGTFGAYRPVLGRLSRGVRVELEPLWTVDETAADLGITIQTVVIRKLHQAPSAAPLGTGKQSALVHVPEVAATLLHETARWPVHKVLLISVGVQPGILTSSRGIRGWISRQSATELLILVEMERGISDGGQLTKRR